MVLLAVTLALILGLIQLFSEQIVKTHGKYYSHVLSFSAGISITYIFIDLFPRFSINAIEKNRFLFITVLIGFIFVHLIEKYVYQHSNTNILDKRIEVINQFISVFYHVILGIIIFEFSEESITQTFLLFVPIAIFTAVNTLPVRSHSRLFVRLFVSLSTVGGVFLAWFFISAMQGSFEIALIGFVIGVLLFSVIRHSIPTGKKGRPLFFIIGVVFYGPIVLYILTL